MSNNILKRKYSEISDANSISDDESKESIELNESNDSLSDSCNISEENDSEEKLNIINEDDNLSEEDLEVQVEYYKSQIETDDYLKTYNEDENGDYED